MNIQTEPSRAYRQGKRAEAAEHTRQRILASGLRRFRDTAFDQVTLENIAADAGVTVQTVLRRFGSKEDLFRACAEQMRAQILGQRQRAPVDDIPGVVDNLIAHYEQWGKTVLHLLAQEHQVTLLAEVLDAGRQTHREWVIDHLPGLLTDLAPANRKRRIAQLVAVTDVYTWRLLRLQAGLSRRQTRQAMTELVAAFA